MSSKIFRRNNKDIGVIERSHYNLDFGFLSTPREYGLATFSMRGISKNRISEKSFIHK